MGMMKHQQDNLKNNNNVNLLLRRAHGKIFDDIPDENYVGFHYFSLLSTESFSVIENICFPFYKTGHVSRPPHVCGTCDGLLCLVFADDRFALWNPSTREIKFLPQSTVSRPPVPHSTDYPYNDCTFDVTSSTCIGFGFDSKSQDYKVVRFITQYYQCDYGSCPCSENQVQLYSLKSDSWKEIPHPEEAESVRGNGFFSSHINGSYYWIAFAPTHCILSFDFANEKFSTIPSPDIVRSLDYYNEFELLDFNGLLGLLVYHNKKGIEKSFDLWVMNSGTWTREFNIQSVSGVEYLLGIWKNGELILESSNNELLLLDPTTREIKNLGIHAYDCSPQDRCFSGQMQIATYVESLVPINGRSELEENIVRQPKLSKLEEVSKNSSQ